MEVEKNICQLVWPQEHGFKPGWSADVSFDLQLWFLISLQPLDKNQCLVPHLKDLFHICLGDKAQGFWKTFNMFNLGSKYPYFNRAYVVSGGFSWTHLYVFWAFWDYFQNHNDSLGILHEIPYFCNKTLLYSCAGQLECTVTAGKASFENAI